MHSFPFTDEEWSPVKDVALSILDADAAGDTVLKASLRLEMLELLEDLRESHGDHPVLLESIADYLDDTSERADLYRQAIGLATLHNLPTLSIRLSFAWLLVDRGESVAALEELQACGGELHEAKDAELEWWRQLLRDSAYESVDDVGRVLLYQRAIEIASAFGQPKLYLRLCLVRFLLDEGKPSEALEELQACERELPEAKDDELAWWEELLKEVGRTAQDDNGPSHHPA